MKAMKILNKHPQYHPSRSSLPAGWHWFNAEYLSPYCCIQDTIHIGGKLRNRLLNSSLLSMGHYIASRNHLQILIDTVPKDQHKLTSSDIDGHDRMNFKAVDKIINDNVSALLKKNIVVSDATQSYLTFMRRSISAFTLPSMSPTQRINDIWYAIFFCRIWRHWLKSTNFKTENFISINSYECIEINGHSLINIIMKLNMHNNSKFFLPLMFNSQTCESFFRRARSLTTTNSTVINFSLLEIFHRTKRINMQADIINDLNEKIIFPREKRFVETEKIDLPDAERILEIVLKAKKEALDQWRILGIDMVADNVFQSEITVIKETDSYNFSELRDDGDSECILDDDLLSEDLLIDLCILNNSNTRNMSVVGK